MITINDIVFYDKPGSCGSCPFFDNGGTSSFHGSEIGYCRLFDEMHRRWINPPRRCQKLFNKAFRTPEGSRLVIVRKEAENE